MTPEEVVVDAPAEVVDAPKDEAKTDKPFILDSSRSLNSQVKDLLRAVPEKEEDSEEKPKEEEPAKKVEEPAVVDDDDVEEVEYKEPKALPEWSKYVLDGLPTIQTMGHGEDGKDKLFTVKRLEDLPDDFEFASKRAELAFNAALSAQEINARELLAKYKEEENAANVTKFQAQEAVTIQRDIKALQKEGILPKFQYAESDPKFNDDPAVKEANAIYDLYQKTNAEYYRKYSETGTSYRISFSDAADKYYAQKYRNTPKEEPKPEPKKEAPKESHDKEREAVAKKVSAPQSAAPESQRRPIRSGTTPQDIYQMYKNGRI